MKTLLIGGSSLLGKYLLQTAPPGYEIETTWYTNYVGLGFQMDVCDRSQVEYIFDRTKPELVIHCATITKVDYAESHPHETRAVCVDGALSIVRACQRLGAKLVYPSTNAVFGGDEPLYAEDADRKPVNVYGRFRAEAELVVEHSNLDWMIVRTFLLYGWPWPGGRENWATILAGGLAKGKSYKLVNDRFWQPTYALDCAKAIWKLIEIGNWKEIYHVAGSDRLSLWEFGCMVQMVFNLDKSLLSAVGSDAFPDMAARPVDSTFDLSKAHALGIKSRGVVAGLGEMRKEIK